MIEFQAEWIFYLAPLPLAARYLLKPPEPHRAALRVAFLDDFASPDRARAGSARLRLVLAALAWALLLAAAAQPQRVHELSQVSRSGRDLMMAVDISQSMSASDFVIDNRRVSRLVAAKQIGSDFIARREGDRIGLILFAAKPFLQMPLSFDVGAAGELLRSAVIGWVNARQTAIGDAIGFALRQMRERDEGRQVLILLTDGASNIGLAPDKAAELAALEGLKIYTIGIGADARTARRWGIRSDLDEAALDRIAKKTGGRYFRARDTRELQQVYRLIDELELIDREPELFRVREALYQWPLALFALTAMTLMLMTTARR